MSLALATRQSRLQIVLVDGVAVATGHTAAELRPLEYLPHSLGQVVESVDDAISTLDFLAREINYRRQQRIQTPAIVVVIDEIVGLLSTANQSIVQPLTQLAQRGTAAGIHLVMTTGKPSDPLMSQLLKACVPVRVVGQVESPQAAQAAAGLPNTGAEQLVGQGDFLAFANGDVTRFQAGYLDEYDFNQCLSLLHRSGGDSILAQPFDQRIYATRDEVQERQLFVLTGSDNERVAFVADADVAAELMPHVADLIVDHPAEPVVIDGTDPNAVALLRQQRAEEASKRGPNAAPQEKAALRPTLYASKPTPLKPTPTKPAAAKPAVTKAQPARSAPPPPPEPPNPWPRGAKPTPPAKATPKSAPAPRVERVEATGSLVDNRPVATSPTPVAQVESEPVEEKPKSSRPLLGEIRPRIVPAAARLHREAKPAPKPTAEPETVADAEKASADVEYIDAFDVAPSATSVAPVSQRAPRVTRGEFRPRDPKPTRQAETLAASSEPSEAKSNSDSETVVPTSTELHDVPVVKEESIAAATVEADKTAIEKTKVESEPKPLPLPFEDDDDVIPFE